MSRCFRANGYYVFAYAAVAIISLWLRSGFPVFAINAGYDDFLFIRLAHGLGSGQWLGPYDNLTLAKGMFYPLFILGSFGAGLPLKIAEHLVYLFAAAAFSWLTAHLARSRALGFVLFAVLAFNPVLWNVSLARVIREGVYIGLSLALVALAAAVLRPCKKTDERFGLRRLGLGLSAGLVAGAFWLTREEGIWIIPAIGVICIATVVASLVAVPKLPLREVVIRLVANKSLPIAAGMLVAVGTVLIVSGLNKKNYGVFTDVEMRASGFVSAFGALSRIQHKNWQRFVLLPKDAREKAYKVSPAAAELRPSLDGQNGENWRVTGCQQQRVDPCPEILGGWFIWALRDAVAAAGHYRTGGDAEKFYWRLASEINAACDAVRIDCFPYRKTLRTPFRSQYAEEIGADSGRMLRLLLTFDNGQIGSAPSIGTEDSLAIFRAVVGPISNPQLPAHNPRRLAGWVAGRDSAPEIALTRETPGRVEVMSAPDVDQAMIERGFFSRRFQLFPDCNSTDCALTVKNADGTIRNFPLLGLKPGVVVDGPDVVLFLDSVDGTGEALAQGALAKRQIVIKKIADLLTEFYVLVVPVLFASAILGLVVSLFLERSDPSRFFLAGLGWAAAAAVASRVLLLSYIDVTTFPALNMLYLSSATSFVLVVVVLGNWLWITMTHHKIIILLR